MHVHDMFDRTLLRGMLGQGYVRERRHPTLPLAIFNYAEKAAYERVWNEVTRACRGLIVADDGQVVARPWTKFFNYGQPEAGEMDLNAPVEVTDKLDGSLGVLYPTLGGHAVATRGSFTSDQAVHATAVYRDRYHGRWDPDPQLTYLFEIVYPSNRIVCDYQGLDDLVLLGAVAIGSGKSNSPRLIAGEDGWPGPVVGTFPHATLAEALAAPTRRGAEGLVVRYLDRHVTVKLKQPDYVALHKLVTGLNERVVWERLGAGETVADMCASIPDEFHGWVQETARGLFGARDGIIDAARAAFAEMQADPAITDRKTFAAAAARSPHRPWLFLLLDGKHPEPQVWRTLRPRADTAPLNVSEDVA